MSSPIASTSGSPASSGPASPSNSDSSSNAASPVNTSFPINAASPGNSTSPILLPKDPGVLEAWAQFCERHPAAKQFTFNDVASTLVEHSNRRRDETNAEQVREASILPRVTRQIVVDGKVEEFIQPTTGLDMTRGQQRAREYMKEKLDPERGRGEVIQSRLGQAIPTYSNRSPARPIPPCFNASLSNRVVGAEYRDRPRDKSRSKSRPPNLDLGCSNGSRYAVHRKREDCTHFISITTDLQPFEADISGSILKLEAKANASQPSGSTPIKIWLSPKYTHDQSQLTVPYTTPDGHSIDLSLLEMPKSDPIWRPSELALMDGYDTRRVGRTPIPEDTMVTHFRENPPRPLYEWRSVQFQNAMYQGNAQAYHPTEVGLLAKLANIPEFFQGVTKFLSASDIISVFQASPSCWMAFKANQHAMITDWARQVPEAAKILNWKDDDRKGEFSVPDPMGKLDLQNKPYAVPLVPKMKWFGMIQSKQRRIEDILALFARKGLRCPQGTVSSLLKLEYVMGLDTNASREMFLDNRDKVTDQDLYNMTLFFIKFDMFARDPMFVVPGGDKLRRLFFGQKSLFPMYQMLFGHDYRDTLSVSKLKLKFDVFTNWSPPNFTNGESVFLWLRDNISANNEELLGTSADRAGYGGLNWSELGVGVYEHRGARSAGVGLAWHPRGNMQLLKHVDQHVYEAAERRPVPLRLSYHFLAMALWGNIDHNTGKNLTPSLNEMRMEDAGLKLQQVDQSNMFTVVEANKAKWSELTKLEREKTILAQGVRENGINRFDTQRFHDPRGTSRENSEARVAGQGREARAAGLHESITFRVDANGKEIPVLMNPHEAPLDEIEEFFKDPQAGIFDAKSMPKPPIYAYPDDDDDDDELECLPALDTMTAKNHVTWQPIGVLADDPATWINNFEVGNIAQAFQSPEPNSSSQA